jgi:hypothetical protein
VTKDNGVAFAAVGADLLEALHLSGPGADCLGFLAMGLRPG